MKLVALPTDLYPLALRFVPTTQALGRSASICSRDCPPLNWQSRRRGSLGLASPLQGQPHLRVVYGFDALAFGFSRAAMAVESLEMCPTTASANAPSISALCIRCGSSVSVNQAKAREKVDSLGIAPTRSQPQRRRNLGSHWRRSINARVVGKSQTALAMKDHANARRSERGQPRPYECV